MMFFFFFWCEKTLGDLTVCWLCYVINKLPEGNPLLGFIAEALVTTVGIICIFLFYSIPNMLPVTSKEACNSFCSSKIEHHKKWRCWYAQTWLASSFPWCCFFHYFSLTPTFWPVTHRRAPLVSFFAGGSSLDVAGSLCHRWLGWEGLDGFFAVVTFKEVSQKWGTPKWMVYRRSILIERDDLGVPLFQEVSIC